MKAGAVIVDLSAEGGGNCEDTQPGSSTCARWTCLILLRGGSIKTK